MSLKSPFTTKVGKGSYSTIVYLDGDLCVAEDSVGTIIKENTDAATVIQAAVDDLAFGKLLIAKGDYTIPSADININTASHRISIEGEGIWGYHGSTEQGTKLIFSNSHGLYFSGTGWNTHVRNLELEGDGTGKAISNDSPSGNFNHVVFEFLQIRNFETGIELNKVNTSRFVHIYMRDATKGFRLIDNSYGPYLEDVRTYGTCSEGIYLSWAEEALLHHCDGGSGSTFGFKLKGSGITLVSPYTENTVKMFLGGSGILVLGGLVHGEVVIGYDANAHGVFLINMVNYNNRNTITFNVNDTYESDNIIIDTNAWTPTVTDTKHRALVRSTVSAGEDKHYIKISNAGHHYNDLLAIPTSLPTYGVRAGTMYFDTSTKALKIYDGAAWKSVTLT